MRLCIQLMAIPAAFIISGCITPAGPSRYEHGEISGATIVKSEPQNHTAAGDDKLTTSCRSAYSKILQTEQILEKENGLICIVFETDVDLMGRQMEGWNIRFHAVARDWPDQYVGLAQFYPSVSVSQSNLRHSKSLQRNYYTAFIRNSNGLACALMRNESHDELVIDAFISGSAGIASYFMDLGSVPVLDVFDRNSFCDDGG